MLHQSGEVRSRASAKRAAEKKLAALHTSRPHHSTMKSKKAPARTGMPVRDDVTEVTYHRRPTAGELRFGEGATHYRTFPVEDCCFPGTRILRKWFVADDGLRYSRG